MACSFSIDTETREFPKSVLFVLKDGFKSKIKTKTKCLGFKTVENGRNKVTITANMKNNIHFQLFAEWYIKEIDYGQKDFTIKIPYLGITRDWRVRMLSEFDAQLTGTFASKITIELEILDDIQQVMDETELEICGNYC